MPMAGRTRRPSRCYFDASNLILKTCNVIMHYVIRNGRNLTKTFPTYIQISVHASIIPRIPFDAIFIP